MGLAAKDSGNAIPRVVIGKGVRDIAHPFQFIDP